MLTNGESRGHGQGKAYISKEALSEITYIIEAQCPHLASENHTFLQAFCKTIVGRKCDDAIEQMAEKALGMQGRAPIKWRSSTDKHSSAKVKRVSVDEDSRGDGVARKVAALDASMLCRRWKDWVWVGPRCMASWYGKIDSRRYWYMKE